MQLNHHDDMSDSENDGPEVDEAGPQASTPLQYGMFHVYLFMQGNFHADRSCYARPWIYHSGMVAQGF